MKLWAGRFQKETDTLVNDFNASITFDSRLYKQDITGSIAHATMLGEQGIIAKEDADAIVAGLKAILTDIEDGKVEFSLDNEDIHMNIETILTERIGAAGKRLHTGRSRNDQVAAGLPSLSSNRRSPKIIDMLLDLEDVLVQQGRASIWIRSCPATPTCSGHSPSPLPTIMMAYANMFRRDITPLRGLHGAHGRVPAGRRRAGHLLLPRQPVSVPPSCWASTKPTENSLDSVSDRDYAIEFLSACSLCMMHLSRFSEEIILWCSWEFKFVDLDDAYSTGSSIMPQKKNPDVAELVRGKTGRVYGDLVSLLTVMKGLPLAYNKDMQEDKEPVFDAIDTIEMCIPVFGAMLRSLTVRPKNMAKAAAGGFINATDCADYLTKKGMPFREAYMIVGRLVNMCIQSGETLDTLTLRDFRAISNLFDADIYDALELKHCVSERKVFGGPSHGDVERQISYIKDFVAQRREEQ